MARRAIVFADVLGFKALVENVPQPTLVKIYSVSVTAAALDERKSRNERAATDTVLVAAP